MVEVNNTRTEATPNAGIKIVQVLTEEMDAADTTVVDLTALGIKTLLNVISQAHATDGSVIVTEAATTAVSSGALTVTAASGNDGKKRSILIVGA